MRKGKEKREIREEKGDCQRWRKDLRERNGVGGEERE